MIGENFFFFLKRNHCKNLFFVNFKTHEDNIRSFMGVFHCRAVKVDGRHGQAET